MKKLAFIFSIFTLAFGVANAQKDKLTLVGMVADSAFKQPLAFCNVQILSKNDTSKRLAATTTDIDGQFSIKKINNVPSIIKISYVGYATLVLDLNFAASVGDTLHLDTLFMVSEYTDLGMLTIEAKARRFEMDVDKLTMNIDPGLSGASENAFDLLKKTPGISIDQDEALTLNGQSGARFQFSGKDMKIDWEAMKSMLKSMAPEKVQKIEIINNPSAKYESEGAGIINIVFDRQKNYGINGSVGTDASYDVAWNNSASASLSYMDAKWTISTWGGANKSRNKRLESWSSTKKWQDGQDTVLFYGSSPQFEDINKGSYAGFYGDYTIDSNNLIGFDASYNGWNSPTSFNSNQTQISSSQDGYQTIDSAYNAANKSSSSSRFLDLGLNYIHAFDTNETKISTDLDFHIRERTYFTQQDYSYFLGNFATRQRYKGQSSDSYNQTINVSWKVDFQKKLFTDGKLETGFKFNSNTNDNNYDAQINNDSVYINDTTRTNNFEYTENIYALYLSYSHKFGKKLNIRAGMRGEYTYTIGKQEINNITHTFEYPNLFPNARIGYMINDKNRLTLDYNYRMSRPSYNILNPFLIKESEYSESQGNPYIKPSYTHNLSLSHSWNYCLTTSFDYGYTTNSIVRVPQLRPNTMITLEKPQNLATAHYFGVHINFNKSFGDKFHCFLAAGSSYQQSQYMAENKLVDFNSFGANGWANLSYQLPLKINLSMFGWISWNQGLSIYKSTPWYNTTLSASRSFLDNSLRISISASNLFSTGVYKSNYETPYTIYESESKQTGMRFVFSAKYSFGRMYEKKKLTGIKSDDHNDRSGASQK